MARRRSKGLAKARCVVRHMKNGMTKANARKKCKVKGFSGLGRHHKRRKSR